jgi:hypothetical protein
LSKPEQEHFNCEERGSQWEEPPTKPEERLSKAEERLAKMEWRPAMLEERNSNSRRRRANRGNTKPFAEKAAFTFPYLPNDSEWSSEFMRAARR